MLYSNLLNNLQQIKLQSIKEMDENKFCYSKIKLHKSIRVQE